VFEYLTLQWDDQLHPLPWHVNIDSIAPFIIIFYNPLLSAAGLQSLIARSVKSSHPTILGQVLATASWNSPSIANIGMAGSYDVNGYTGYQAVATSIVFVVVAGAFVAARLVVRLGIIQQAGSDDWVILGSLVSL